MDCEVGYLPVFILMTGAISVGLFLLLVRQKQFRNQLSHRLRQETLERESLASRLAMQQVLLEETADELHENVGQLLTVTQLVIYTIEEKIGDSSTTPDFKKAFDSLQTSIQAVRGVSNTLKKGRNPDLWEGLKKICDRIRQSGPFEVDLTRHGAVRPVSHRAEPILLQLVQELAKTVLERSAGTTLTIRLKYVLSSLYITLSDENYGFTLPAEPGRFSAAIQTINQKMALLGGRCLIASEEGKGTWVVIRLPTEFAETKTASAVP
ncbi:sensor histidine kinase [Larkinella sp.]|uniref:sensor histidine kinase n=1 Tax=Larkinella sp. TaxID=2034517 RepID=UPI003BAB435C